MDLPDCSVDIAVSNHGFAQHPSAILVPNHLPQTDSLRTQSWLHQPGPELLCDKLVTKTWYSLEMRRLFRITLKLLSQVQNMSLDRAYVWMATIFPDLA
jgi:hypothetical protein